MAKLSQANLAASKHQNAAHREAWNASLATPTTSKRQMPPPTSRPRPPQPETPAQHEHLGGSVNGEQNPSSRKKRRRRGGKKIGDSASEVATTISEDVVQDARSPISDEAQILVQASQPNVNVLQPNASAEEKRIFENEPEMYGVYATSDEDEEAEDAVHQSKKLVTLPRRQRVQTYSPSVAPGHEQSSPLRVLQEDVQPIENSPSRPQVVSDLIPDAATSIPASRKLQNGRFACPLEVEYSCSQTFAHAKGATRHANAHVNAGKFQCEECEKSYSRKDSFLNHLKSHARRINPARSPENFSVAKTKAQSTRNVGVENSTTMTKNNTATTETERGYSVLDSELAPASSKPDRHASGENDETSATESEQSETEQEDESGTDTKHAPNEQDATIEESDIDVASPALSEMTTPSSPEASRRSDQLATCPVSESRLKRKRQAPQSPEVTFKLQSRKRLRRDSGKRSPSLPAVSDLPMTDLASLSTPAEADTTKTSMIEHSDIEQDGHYTAVGNEDGEADDGQDTSTEMIERSDDEEQSEAEDTVALNGNLASPDHVSDDETSNIGSDVESGSDTSELASEEAEGEDIGMEAKVASEDEHVVHRESASRQSKQASVGSAVPTTMNRQSSMDSFVQRSQPATKPVASSASRPQISVNVPSRSQLQSQKTQTKLNPHRQSSAIRPSRKAGEDLTNVSESQGSDSSDAEEGAAGRSRKLDKGKGRAVSQSPELSEDGKRVKTSSSARRAISTTAKGNPRLRSRKIASKKVKAASDAEDSPETTKAKSKQKSKAAPKKRARADSDDEHPHVANASWAEASKSGRTGRFSEEENRTVLAWRDSFCSENSMSAHEFNEMMTNSLRQGKDNWPYNWITKTEFMQQFYDLLPNRNRRSMLRFRERNFQNVESARWTEADDKELAQLVAQLGTKWVDIGQLMGRTQDAVSQRWRHKLNYGQQPALMGDWTSEEVSRLEAEVMAFAQTKGKSPEDDDLIVPWQAISKKLGNGRTAQQCSNRWRINTRKRVNGKFVKIPHSDRIPSSQAKSPRTPSKMEKRLSGQRSIRAPKEFKSAERIENSDDDGDEEDEQDENAGEEHEQSENDADDSHEETPPKAPAENDAESSEVQSDEAFDDNSEDVSDGEEQEQELSPRDRVTKANSRSSPVSASRAIANKDEAHGSSQENGTSQSTLHSQHNEVQPGSSQDVTTGTQSQNVIQPPTTETPNLTRNPLKRSRRNHDTPSMGLSQLYAGTQANSSAKRTTGRTNRTRIPDSVRVEDRPSPDIGLQQRPVRSSSPLMTLLAHTSHGTVDDEEDEEESEDEDESDTEKDFKSPTTYVSAKDATHDTGSDENMATTDAEDEDSISSSGSESASGSEGSSERRSRTDAQQSNSSFWQSINQNFRKVVGLNQSQSQSQPRSEDSSQVPANQRKKKALSLTDVLRRGALDDESDSDDE